MKLEIDQLSTIGHTAQAFVEAVGRHKIIAFRGEMGAGKTTFIKALCAALGSPDKVTSPTFSIVNEYLCEAHGTIYHFDFYRIDNLQEAFDMGAQTYFDSGHWCLIEWPEKIEEILPEGTLLVDIVPHGDGRSLNFDPYL